MVYLFQAHLYTSFCNIKAKFVACLYGKRRTLYLLFCHPYIVDNWRTRVMDETDKIYLVLNGKK